MLDKTLLYIINAKIEELENLLATLKTKRDEAITTTSAKERTKRSGKWRHANLEKARLQSRIYYHKSKNKNA